MGAMQLGYATLTLSHPQDDEMDRGSGWPQVNLRPGNRIRRCGDAHEVTASPRIGKYLGIG